MQRSLNQFTFWLLVIVCLTLLFGSEGGEFVGSFIYVMFLFPALFVTSFLVNEVLIKGYLLEAQYRKFILYFLYTLIGSVYLELLALTAAFVLVAKYDFTKLHPFSTNLILLTVTMYLIVFIRSAYWFYRLYLEKEANLAQLKDEQVKNQIETITLKVNRQDQAIRLDELKYIESLSDYVKLVTTSFEVTSKERISNLEEALPEKFIRVHRSFIVNQDFISAFSNAKINVGEIEIPIGRKYKSEALGRLQGCC
jgi:two-component system response regulator LytT